MKTRSSGTVDEKALNYGHSYKRRNIVSSNENGSCKFMILREKAHTFGIRLHPHTEFDTEGFDQKPDVRKNQTSKSSYLERYHSFCYSGRET